MKFLVKYLVAMYGSIFLLINNELSFADVLKSNFSTDSDNVFKANSIDKRTRNLLSKLLTVNVIPSKDAGNSDFHDLGLPIQLMDESYKILLTGTTENGKVMFDLSKLDHIPQNLIILSPITANELVISSEAGYIELMIDSEDQLPLQIAAKYMAEK